jgi:hypothetical protein
MIDTGPGAGATAGEYTVHEMSERDHGGEVRDAVSVNSLGSIDDVARPAQVSTTAADGHGAAGARAGAARARRA